MSKLIALVVGQEVVCTAHKGRGSSAGFPHYGGIYKIEGIHDSKWGLGLFLTLEGLVRENGEQVAFSVENFRPRTDADVPAPRPPPERQLSPDELKAAMDHVAKRLAEAVVEEGATGVTMTVGNGPEEDYDTMKRRLAVH